MRELSPRLIPCDSSPWRGAVPLGLYVTAQGPECNGAERWSCRRWVPKTAWLTVENFRFRALQCFFFLAQD